ncbi:MAG: NAD(P)H-dependent oxidoreductase subunit E [bacterium]
MSFISSNGHKGAIEEKVADEEEELDLGKTEEIIEKYAGGPGSLMAILKDIQDEYKYLPKEALKIVSITMNIPLNKVYHIATFYKAFSLEPLGRHSISVCIGTACHVRGAAKVLEELERQLGIKAGKTTQDRKFTLNSVNCLGACALGPVMVIDGQYFEKVTPGKINSILAKFD